MANPGCTNWGVSGVRDNLHGPQAANLRVASRGSGMQRREAPKMKTALFGHLTLEWSRLSALLNDRKKKRLQLQLTTPSTWKTPILEYPGERVLALYNLVFFSLFPTAISVLFLLYVLGEGRALRQDLAI